MKGRPCILDENHLKSFSTSEFTLQNSTCLGKSQDNSVGIATALQAACLSNRYSIPGRAEILVCTA
jgi:hypothetical protein